MKCVEGLGFLWVAVLAAFFALSACDDSSSAEGDNGSGGNRGGIPDTVETFMELSDYDCGKSQKCVATYLTEYHDMAVCDGNNGWVIGTLIEKMDCDFSSSSAKSSDSKSNDPAEVTDDSSDSKDNPSSAGTSTKSSNSNSSGTTTKSSSSSADKVASSSSSITLATPCKTETEDNCEYGTLTDERDGQEYKTVKIGDQVWMAQNLNYEIAGSRCYKDPYCASFGRFYTWAAAMDSVAEFSDYGKGCGENLTCSPTYPVRGICPSHWHLPSKDEWDILIKIVGGVSAAGKKLRTTAGWLFQENGSDAYSFSALPVGYSTHGSFGNYGYSADFWSSTENGPSAAYAMRLVYGDEARLFNHF